LSVAGVACGDPTPVRVGVVFGGDGLRGAQFAAAEVNANHGIRGRPLVLRVGNDGGTLATAAVIAAESLSLDPTVVAVVGHSNSTASLAGSQIYNTRRVVQIAPTSSSALLTQAGPYTFRLVANDAHQARFLADELVRREAKAVAVFYVNDDYGRSLFDELRARLTVTSVRVAFESPYSQQDSISDARATVQEIARLDATDVVWLGREWQLGQILPLVRKIMPSARVLASDGVDTRVTAENHGGVFTGVQFVCFVDAEGARPQLMALRERYRARTGGTLTADIALSYDAVALIAAAAREEGLGRGDIFDYLRSLGRSRPAFPGATADIAFDNDGDPRPSYCLAEITASGRRTVRTQGEQ
jgi:branched-chain amino acid transport system substrate-binding protein